MVPMRNRIFSYQEEVAGAIVCILAVILWPSRNRPTSFRDTRMPPLHYQNMELISILSDLYRVIQKQRGERIDYHMGMQRRRVWLNTSQDLTLREAFERIEQSAHVKFDYLERPYHPGTSGNLSSETPA